MRIIEAFMDQELAALPLHWMDADGSTIDFSSGWTFTVKVVEQSAPSTVILSKTAGITLDSANPNVTIEWAAADLSTISTALGTIPTSGTVCPILVYARRLSDSKDDVFPTRFAYRFFTAPA